jgi:hypothetical protein
VTRNLGSLICSGKGRCGGAGVVRSLLSHLFFILLPLSFRSVLSTSLVANLPVAFFYSLLFFFLFSSRAGLLILWLLGIGFELQILYGAMAELG